MTPPEPGRHRSHDHRGCMPSLATIACVAATLGTLVGGPLLLAYAGPTTSEQCYEVNQAHDESRWC